MITSSGQLLRRTQSPCPTCGKRLASEVFEANGKVYLTKTCPEHGSFELLLSNHASFYREVLKIVGGESPDPEVSKQFTDFRKIRGICLDLTQHCNLQCANCFANANLALKPDLSLEEIKRIIDRIPGRPPVVFLQGGEPTLHPQLPEIVRYLIEHKCVPKLITNGLRLVDEGLVVDLKQAGLKWVFLQFDGFDNRTYQAFRGRKLLDLKLKVLDYLEKYNFSTLLAVMTQRDYNLAEVGRILEFAFDRKHIRQISFLPSSRIGRNDLTTDQNRTEAVDIIDAMDQATKGGVGRADFLTFMRVSGWLHKLTGNPDYKPKTCFYPMVLYRTGRQIYGLNRILQAPFMLRHPEAGLSALRLALNLQRLDNARSDQRLLWLCIEQFREFHTLDIDDARHCNKLFVDMEGRFVKSCLYNNLYREQLGVGRQC